MPRFYQTKKFEKLESFWRRKLREAGFVDHEDRRGNLVRYDKRTIAWKNRKRIETFYSGLEEFLRTEALPKQDRKILELYALGIRVEGPDGIAERLGYSLRTIRRVIAEYKERVLLRMK